VARIVVCVLFASAVASACSSAPAGSTTTGSLEPTTTTAPITTSTVVDSTTTSSPNPVACCEHFGDPATGISSVVPEGWEALAPTVFAGDGAGLGFWSYPGLGQDLAVAAWGHRLAGSPAVLDPYRTEQYTWLVHSGTTPDGEEQWFAVSGYEGGLHAVAMWSAADDPGLFEEVLQPALDMYAFEEPERSGESMQLAAAGRHLFDYDAGEPLGLEVVDRSPVEGVTLEEIRYTSPAGGEVPADLWIPAGEGPFPALIMMHGLPGDRTQLGAEARAYAAAGVLVMAIDAPFARPEHRDRPEGAITGTEQDRVEQIQLIRDLRRAVDVLAGRPDVDPQRIGYLGVSYGGAMGGLLAGVEPRLSACVLVVGDGGLVSHLTGIDDPPPEDSAEHTAWVAAMWPIEPIHYVADAAMPLLFQSALRDDAVPFDDAIRYQRAAGGDADVVWYDSGHGLPDEAARDRARWLAEHLGFDAAGF